MEQHGVRRTDRQSDRPPLGSEQACTGGVRAGSVADWAGVTKKFGILRSF
jgi:hypothetical protein